MPLALAVSIDTKPAEDWLAQIGRLLARVESGASGAQTLPGLLAQIEGMRKRLMLFEVENGPEGAVRLVPTPDARAMLYTVMQILTREAV